MWLATKSRGKAVEISYNGSHQNYLIGSAYQILSTNFAEFRNLREASRIYLGVKEEPFICLLQDI